MLPEYEHVYLIEEKEVLASYQCVIIKRQYQYKCVCILFAFSSAFSSAFT